MGDEDRISVQMKRKYVSLFRKIRVIGIQRWTLSIGMLSTNSLKLSEQGGALQELKEDTEGM